MTLKQRQTIKKLKAKIELSRKNRRSYRQKKKEEIKDPREIQMIKNWIKANLKEISMMDFFMCFEELYRLEFKKIQYNLSKISKLKEKDPLDEFFVDKHTHKTKKSEEDNDAKS